ncbi:glycosyltransferase [Gordonibacter massiliensis (ex Traore et al. 2017)]|uniref:glycosyltransferase n=1 Tax=Gordonibacter massiliensis (ex Traore et al. 2017) TaxID=1841863 RepID=UPI001C8C070B|nr:glycosyltransferase [Gordonibacter massiliensis (ex Traore et al. 2017)]MBX9033645.1 glycosyltransferase family 4 protein [Gordonibacter massiliensis (ex Traore et al. 2017)]
MFRTSLGSLAQKARKLFEKSSFRKQQTSSQIIASEQPHGAFRTIENIIPANQQQKDAWVNSYLQERGFAPSNIAFDPEPWNSSPLSERIASMQRALRQGERNLILVYERACGDSATFRYFGYNVAQHLNRSSTWNGIYLFVDELADAADIIASANAIALIRCRIRPELLTLAETAKQHMVPLAYIMDDNALGASTAPHIVKLMANNPADSFEQDFWRGATARFHLASLLADCFFAPVSYFAKILESQERKPAYVVHASLNDEQIAIAQAISKSATPKTRKKHFDIGYFSGTSSHQDDFALVHDALIEFLLENNEARLVLGGQLTLSDELHSLMKQEKVVVLPRVDYVTLQYLQAAVDVVLAPLLEDEFTNCKSALKVFEAGVVGTPACASPTVAYLEAVETNVTGMICRNRSEWLAAFRTLYDNRDATNEMGNAARELALSRYYGDAMRFEIENACEALAAAKLSPIPSEVLTALAGKSIEDWDNPFEANPAFASES